MSIRSVEGANPPRLCRIVKRKDFNGYGFNLQAEKGKPGQFIGNVDAGSPAETSGVLKNDRVIEVNGVNVCNEAHKQVVARIKEIDDEVVLLVMDPESERKYLENGIVIKSEMDIVEKHGSTNDILSNDPVSNGEDLRHEIPDASVAVEDEEEVKASVIEVEEPKAADDVDKKVETVTEAVERTEITESVEQSEIQDHQKESRHEEGMDGSSEHGSGTSGVYEVAASAESGSMKEVTEVAEEVKEEAREEAHLNGTTETTPVITDPVPTSETTHNTPPPAMNGDSNAEPKSELIFSMSAVQARAAQTRSRRRAIKETKQTFKEKYLVFENL